MISAIFEGILSFVLWLCSLITSIILLPIVALVEAIFPDFSNFSTYVSNFMTIDLPRGVAWARVVMCNCTGLPLGFVRILVDLFIARLALYYSFIVFKFLLKLYRFLKSGGIDSTDVKEGS